MIVIAHRLSSVRRAHRIVVLDKGRLVEAGSHDELLRRQAGLYAKLWSMQAGVAPGQAPRPSNGMAGTALPDGVPA